MEPSDSLRRAIESGDDNLVVELVEALIKDVGLAKPDSWADGCLRLMAGSVTGEITWPNLVAGIAALHGVDDRIRAAIELAATLGSAGRLTIRKRAEADWKVPFSRLSWADRLDVLIFIDDYVDLDNPSVKPAMCRAACSFVGRDGNAFEEARLLMDLVETLELDDKLDAFERALGAHRAGTLFTRAVGQDDQQRFLSAALATFANSGDEANFERAFDYCVAFELGRGRLESAVVTAGTYRDRLPVKAALVEAVAASYTGDQGSHARATNYLLDEFDRCSPQVADRWLLLEEARIHAGKDRELIAKIDRRDLASGHVRQLPRLVGRIVVVGGGGDMKAKLKRAFGREELQGVVFEHMTANEAKNNGPRLKQLIAGSDGVMIYWWVCSHAASEKAKTEAKAAGVMWMLSTMPSIANFVSDVAELLGKS